MEFAYIITLAAFLVCFLAALVGLRLAASELSSPVPGSSWRRDAFLPMLLVSLPLLPFFLPLPTGHMIRFFR